MYLRNAGSLYFATCFGEHIPEDVDVIFVELGTFHTLNDHHAIMKTNVTLVLYSRQRRQVRKNPQSRYDGLNFANRHVAVQVEYEQLLRGLLDLPNQPAIINMQVFGLLFDPISQGGDQVSESDETRSIVLTLATASWCRQLLRYAGRLAPIPAPSDDL